MRYSIKIIFSVLLLITLVSCDDSGSSSGDSDKLTGTVSGIAVDAATNEPIAGATIRLSYIDEDFEDSVRTNQSGRFAIKDVPVNSAQITISDDDDIGIAEFGNFPYSVHIEMPSGSDYRPNYVLYPIFLNFSATGGDGNVSNLVSSILLPFSKRNVTVHGRILDVNTRAPLSNLRVRAYTESLFGNNLDLGLGLDSELFLAETTTSSDGKFQFESIEQGSEIFFKFVDKNDSTNVVEGQSADFSLPHTDSGEGYTRDVGDIFANPMDRSGLFYITDISLEEGDDVDISSDFAITYQFSKPVKQTNYTDDSAPFDVNSGTMIDDILLFETGSKAKDADGNYEIDLEWSNNFQTLTITPIDEMQNAYTYQLSSIIALNDFTDNEDNFLTFNNSTFVTSLNEAGTINFTTSGDNSAPADPNISVEEYTLDWDGGNVNLNWAIPTSGPEIAYYELYTRTDDVNFQKAGDVDMSNAFNNSMELNYGIGELIRKEQSTYDTPNPLEIKVRAVSENLVKSGFSNVLSISDNVKPGLINAFYNSADSTITATFNEPMDFTSMEPASRYQLIDSFGDVSQDVSVASTNVVYSSNGITEVELTLSEENNVVTNLILRVSTSITDVTGNGVDNNDEDDNTTFNEVNIN